MHHGHLIALLFTLLPLAGTVATISVAVLKGYTVPVGTGADCVFDVTINSTGNAWTYPAGGFSIYSGPNGGLGLRGFDWVGGSLSQGGNYIAIVQVSKAASPAAGTKAQKAWVRLFVPSTGAEVATGAALTADVVRCFAKGG